MPLIARSQLSLSFWQYSIDYTGKSFLMGERITEESEYQEMKFIKVHIGHSVQYLALNYSQGRLKMKLLLFYAPALFQNPFLPSISC